jgi:thiol-disulfide isomerase/thioredoxin
MRQTVLLIGLLCAGMAQAQLPTLKGCIPQLKNNELTLSGYDGFREKELGKAQCDSVGRFALSYPASYTGAAMLQAKGVQGVVLLLNRETFGLQWDNVQDVNSLKFTGSPENEAFAKGIAVNGEAEQKLAGLRYLLPKYDKNSAQHRWLQAEIAAQEKHFQGFINKLPAGNYASKYLKLRKFVADMFAASNRRDTTGLAQIEARFAQIAFADEALWHSGLAVDLFTGFYQLLEGYGDETTISAKTNRATDVWVKALTNDAAKQQEMAEYCFKQLEKHNRIKSAEYLALAMLNGSGCQLDEKRTALFDQYRKMAEGHTAPDITLPDGKKLSELGHKYKLVAFGASWCPDCQRDYPSLVGSYKRIKAERDIECVYVSLDTDTAAYRAFFREAPFITICDTKGWSSPAVKEYCVVATPTIYLLDEKLRIVKRIMNPQQLENYMQSVE